MTQSEIGLGWGMFGPQTHKSFFGGLTMISYEQMHIGMYGMGLYVNPNR